TVTGEDGPAFDEFVRTLERSYPRVFSTCERQDIGRTVLLRWPGRQQEHPSVLMAHYDVVPAPVEGWSHPPFDAEILGEGEERALWGRGTLDDKGHLAAILE